MLIQQLDKARPGLRSSENDLFDEFEFSNHFLQIVQLRPISHDRQPWQQIFLPQQTESINQNIDAFISNQATEENQVPIADPGAVPAKQIVTIRIAHDDGRREQVIGNRLAHRNVSGKTNHELLDAILKTDGSIRASDPCMVGNYPWTTDACQRPT